MLQETEQKSSPAADDEIMDKVDSDESSSSFGSMELTPIIRTNSNETLAISIHSSSNEPPLITNSSPSTSNNAVSTSNEPNQQIKRKPIKGEKLWKSNIRNAKTVLGEEHVSKNGKVVKAKGPCEPCKEGCSSAFTKRN